MLAFGKREMDRIFVFVISFFEEFQKLFSFLYKPYFWQLLCLFRLLRDPFLSEFCWKRGSYIEYNMLGGNSLLPGTEEGDP